MLLQEQQALVEQSLERGGGELPDFSGTQTSGGRSSGSAAVIAASVTAALVFLLLLVAMAYILHTRRQLKKRKVCTCSWRLR